MTSSRSTRVSPRLNRAAAVALALLCAAPALAHVVLVTPNGGETLQVGSVYQITWQVIDHGPAMYDVWYSTTGPEGPWIEVALDVPRNLSSTQYAYDWEVPDSPSDQVRVRVRQDNSQSIDYEDISAGDVAIVAEADTTTVNLTPVQDGTMYEEDGDLANGAGSFLFTGRTQLQSGSSERRALIQFDVAGAVPSGATIRTASLGMTMSKTTSGAQTVALHRVLEEWGEGASEGAGQEGGGGPAAPGDATWVYREYPDLEWATAGGSFAPSATAATEVVGTGGYTWESSSALVADVQSWLDDPEENHGWVVVVPMAQTGSSKRFNSRDNDSEPTRPVLSVTYEGTAQPLAAVFSYMPANPEVGEVVHFVDQSTGSPTSWSWELGDGATSAEQNPNHAFASPGTFTVRLTVGDGSSTDSTDQDVTVLSGGGQELTELVLLPAAARAEGAGGAFFVTTADVHNAGAASAMLRFQWLPRNTDNSTPLESELLMLEPGESRRFGDLLGDVFGVSDAFGAVAVLSDSPELEVVSRTFNQTTQGTYGQGLPGVPASDLVQAGTRVRVLFLTQNDAYRSNLGLANGSGDPVTVQWELFASDGASLATGQTELPPWGNTQLNRVLADFAPIEAAYADVWTTTTGGVFTCYGSVLDQETSDPTTVLPR